MSVLDGSQPVRVPVGPCRCEGGPHTDGDWVELAGTASLELGLAAQGAIGAFASDRVALERELGVAFLHHGITGWSFVFDDGSPIPVTPDNIDRALPWGNGGSLLAERADELYTQAVLDPLRRRLRTGSQPGPTADGTSRNRAQRRSRRSSSPSSSPAASAPST